MRIKSLSTVKEVVLAEYNSKKHGLTRMARHEPMLVSQFCQAGTAREQGEFISWFWSLRRALRPGNKGIFPLQRPCLHANKSYRFLLSIVHRANVVFDLYSCIPVKWASG
jgi:hypothetical protein